MKNISFAWTTDALLAGRKTCTCRDWERDYAERFKAGDLTRLDEEPDPTRTDRRQ